MTYTDNYKLPLLDENDSVDMIKYYNKTCIILDEVLQATNKLMESNHMKPINVEDICNLYYDSRGYVKKG